MFRRTLVWAVLLALVGAVSGGVFVGWTISQTNAKVREKLLETFAEKTPHWDVAIERAEFDWNRTVRVFGATVRPKGDAEDLVVLPEIVVTIDREAFDRDEEVVLQRIRLVGPQVRLRRTVDGAWNWQRLFPLESKERRSLPEWIVEDGVLSVELDHGDGEPTSLPAGRVNGKVVPSGKRRFEVVGRVDVDGTGAFDLSGELDVDRKTWSFGGRAVDLVSGEELVDLAARVAPETRTRIAELEERVDGWLPDETERRSVRVADASDDAVVRNATDTRRVDDRSDKPLGIDGRLALEFQLEQPAGGKSVVYSVQAEFDGAQLDHPALPFPLHDVDGRVVWGNERFAVENLVARNGVTRIAASGEVRRGDRADGQFDLQMNDVVLDERLRSRLVGRLRTVYDSFRPTGRADFRTRVVVENGTARTEGLVLNLKQASAAYAAFPYPVERVNGSLAQQDEDLVIDLAGFGGRVPITLKGTVKDFTGDAEAAFAIVGKGLPIDRTFLDACQPQVRAAFDSLQLEGKTDLSMRFLKPAGRNQRWRTRLEANLFDASMEFTGFPYRVTRLTGKIVGNTHEGTWRFEELVGNHGDAQLTAFGSFVKPEPTDPGRLRLRIVTRNAPLDNTLRDAFDDTLQDAWRSIDPTGRLDVVTDVDWTPGRPPDVRLPAVAISKATMRPDALPLRFTDVTLEGAYAEGRFDVAKFSGRHRDAAVRSKGFFEVDDAGRWRLRFDDLFVDDLDAGPILRDALPKTLADVHESIDLRGKVSLSGRAEFRGSTNEETAVTAAWELDTVLTGNRFFAGVPVEDAYGSLASKGTYDGRKTVVEGELDLDSLTAQGYQLTQLKGPYRIDGVQLLLGSRKAFAEKVPPIALEERVTAKAIDGTIVVDGLYVGGAQPSYNFKFLLSNGRLESYAERYLPGTKNLRGVMNGWLDLYGRGVAPEDVQGRGQLQISPAALYELPLVVKLFTALPFRPPRQAAFDYALLEFRIARERFAFDAIDLVGDSLSLRGRGTVGFDQSVNLDFYSQQPRSQLNIPVVRLIVGEAARGLVAVYVRGNLERPQTQVVTAPTVDAALKSFLGRLTNPGPPPTNRIRNVLTRPLGGRSSGR